MNEKLLEIKNLSVTIGERQIVDNVNFDLYCNQTVALVGESGSGKTMTALAILNLLPASARIDSGEIMFKDEDIFRMRRDRINDIRGNDIAMVFQEPFTALNPVMRVGQQIREVIVTHEKEKKERADEKVKTLLEMVQLSPEVTSSYPHELSGGMRQRVVLAMALACDPKIIILDEPTTALDVSIQEQVLALIKDVQAKVGFGILFISHDFSVVNMIADQICVMRSGIIVEKGEKKEVLFNPNHEYTKKLIDCVPRLGDERRRLPE